MQALKSFINISNNNQEEKENLKSEINSLRSKLEQKKFNYISSTSPKCQTDFLKYLVGLYTIDSNNNFEINSKYVQLLESVPIELLENYIPQIVGCYVLYTQIFPDLEQLLFDIILKLSKHSLKVSHMIYFNLLSSKNSYKKYISPLEIKSLMTKFMKNWQCSDEELTATAVADYVSMFNKISTFDEFIDKNISVSNVQEMKSYINNSEVKWDKMMSNIKSNLNSEEELTLAPKSNPNESSGSLNTEVNGSSFEQFKWKHFISTLNFVNDLVTISEMLKFIPLDYRNKALSNFIRFINTMELPSAYLSLDFTSSITHDYFSNHNRILLRICEENAFCLSTKDKVPFHILLEIGEQNPSGDIENIITNHNIGEGIANMDNKSNQFKKSQELFTSFKEELEKVTENDKKADSSSQKDAFKPIPMKPAKEQTSFFSHFFRCCSVEHVDDGHDEDYQDNLANSEKSKDSSSYLHGLFGDKTFSEVSSSLLKQSKNQDQDFAKNRQIVSVIVKGNEDMRQDQFVYQVMEIFLSIFEKENLEIYLKPLKIISASRGGIIETLTNTTSLQKIKGNNYDDLITTSNTLSISNSIRGDNNINSNSSAATPSSNDNIKSFTSYKSNLLQFYSANTIASNSNTYGSLKSYFILKFGNSNSQKYKQTVNNFMISLVGYSLLCYVLEIQDRNNGNILVDDEGHIIHIDFGFLLSHSPGNLNFEKAPFKLTSEFVELLDGFESDLFRTFQDLFWKGFMALRNNINYITSFIDIYILSNCDLPCFYRKETISDSIREKLLLDYSLVNFNLSESESKEATNNLILYSYENWRTKFYDRYQKYCVGIN